MINGYYSYFDTNLTKELLISHIYEIYNKILYIKDKPNEFCTLVKDIKESNS